MFAGRGFADAAGVSEEVLDCEVASVPRAGEGEVGEEFADR